MIKTAKISPKQIALLHVAKRELSLDEGNYRAVLSLYGGAESAKDVTQAGFTRLMNYLVRIGFKAPAFAPQTRGEANKMIECLKAMAKRAAP